MKKWISFIVEWFSKLWRLVLYIGGMIALILGLVDVFPSNLCLIVFLDCMVVILIPRICDEVLDPLLKKDDKEN
jgi:hypothetical protein